MAKYVDRHAAGKMLAERLTHYANCKDALVLGLPRGGVPVAYEIAQSLNLTLDVFIVRKLGVPGYEELAFGAIALGDVVVFNDTIIKDLNLTKDIIQKVILAEKKELQRREIAYRPNCPPLEITNKVIILVDDGIATGATMQAAINALKKSKPKCLVVAVPVAAKTTCDEMENKVDQFICPLRPLFFNAVGAWYEDFSQTTDAEVLTLLNRKHT